MKKILKVMKRIFLGLIFCCLAFILVHRLLCFYENRHYPSPYSYVEVQGKKISYAKQGNGDTTIILLPGLGTVAPILDFEPLADRLAENNTVITIEPFGYGYSDLSNEPRTISNEVSELHEAITKIGVSTPYILMPHSISGLTSIAYVDQYPKEVQGIIGIDCTLPDMPSYFEEELPDRESDFSGHLCDLGLMRLISIISPSALTSDNTLGIYSSENLKMQRMIAARRASNVTIIHENNAIEENILATKNLSFSSELPILFFTLEVSNASSLENPKSNRSFFESYITNPSIQSVTVYDAPHYMHQTRANEMADAVEVFKKKAVSVNPLP